MGGWLYKGSLKSYKNLMGGVGGFYYVPYYFIGVTRVENISLRKTGVGGVYIFQIGCVGQRVFILSLTKYRGWRGSIFSSKVSGLAGFHLSLTNYRGWWGLTFPSESTGIRRLIVSLPIEKSN